MLDIRLRPVKDNVFDPICIYVPSSISPTQITIAAFCSGLLSCMFAANQHNVLALGFWALNRALDCLDGALARYRRVSSDYGGFLDLLGDFVVYSFLPMAVVLGFDDTSQGWRAVAVLEASFHVNNFILFYVASVAEKLRVASAKDSTELTSVMMRPALIEGTESAILFTLMLAYPAAIQLLSSIMAGLVCIGICQRVAWTLIALGKQSYGADRGHANDRKL